MFFWPQVNPALVAGFFVYGLENRLTQAFVGCYKSAHRVFLYHLIEGDNT